MIRIPLSQSGPADKFAAEVEAHRAALASHRVGKPGIAAPTHTALIEALIVQTPQTGPVASRGPDSFTVAPYEIFDDAPKTPEAEQALKVLRETVV